MADEIALDRWLISARAAPDGGLTIAVARDGEPYATLVVPPPEGRPPDAGGKSRKLTRDMDF